MLGRWTKILATTIANSNKKRFLEHYEKLQINKDLLDLEVISLCGERQATDMIYSICSFHHNIGLPSRWFIYNDGSLMDSSISRLNNLRNVEVRFLPDIPFNFPAPALKMYKTLWKLEILLSLKIEKTTIISDSDILYFNHPSKWNLNIMKGNHYIIDEGKGYFDDSYYPIRPKLLPPLNLGFLVLNSKDLDWSETKKYVIDLYNVKSLGYWSDQSAIDMFAIANQFNVLPKDLFVVGGNDSFKLTHCCDYNCIALRHFVGPVRHKMWQYPWEKVLGIS